MGAGRSTDHLLGTVIAGRYTLTDAIGTGAMGKVYRARHVFLHSDVAIKILHGHLCGHRQYLDRFLREARAAAGVEHDNVMSVTDFGELPGGSAFFAMELLLGEDLSHLLEREGRLTWSRARNLVVQIVRGLAAVHAAGVVHRDVKPANCFLIDEGKRVKIIDFGIAKLDPMSFDTTQHRTLVGTVMGTPYYMSPEQALGEPVDARTDVYAVGALLYRMLTGRVPFVGSAQEVRRQHITSPVPSPSEAGGVPLAPEVEQLVLKAMAKDPRERFESMVAFESAILGAWAADATGTTRPGTTAAPPRTGDTLNRTASGTVSRTQIWEQAQDGDGESSEAPRRESTAGPADEGDEVVDADVVVRSAGAVAPTQIWTVDDEPNVLPAVRDETIAPVTSARSRSSAKFVLAAVAVALGGVAWIATRGPENSAAAHDAIVDAGATRVRPETVEPSKEISPVKEPKFTADTHEDVAANSARTEADEPSVGAVESPPGKDPSAASSSSTPASNPKTSTPPEPSKRSKSRSSPSSSKSSSSKSSSSKRTLTPADIERLVAGVAPKLNVCSEHAGGQRPLLRAKFVIPEQGGHVQKPEVVGEYAGTALGDCVQRVLGERLRFPASDRSQPFTARLRIR